MTILDWLADHAYVLFKIVVIHLVEFVDVMPDWLTPDIIGLP